MINSTITKFIGLGLLFSVIIVSGYTLLSNTDVNAITTHNTDTALAQSTSETALEADEMTDMPVVKLASLSIMTDYPAMHDSDLTAKMSVDIEERMTSANQLAAEQKFEDALKMLKTTPTTDQEKYSVDYLRAQILSWSGDHPKAEQAFVELRRQYPQDADIAVSFGYLHLYQNNFEDAERLFSQVLARFPDYQDAQHGLKRATAIQ